RWFRLAGLLCLGLTLVISTSTAQEKDKKDAKADNKDAKTDKKEKDAPGIKIDDEPKGKKEKFTWGAHLDGKLTVIEPNSQRDFTLQVTKKVPEPNPGAQQNLINQQRQLQQQQLTLAQQTQQAQFAKSAQERAQALQRVQQTQLAIQRTQLDIAKTTRDLIRYKDVSKDYKMRAVDDVKVRSYKPPLDYDEKGNVRVYTKEELAKMKGKESLPGYQTE